MSETQTTQDAYQNEDGNDSEFDFSSIDSMLSDDSKK